MLVQLVLLGKEEIQTRKKRWEHAFFFFAYMTKDLMFSFLITSLTVIEAFPVLSNTQGRVDFTFPLTHPPVRFISIIAIS